MPALARMRQPLTLLCPPHSVLPNGEWGAGSQPVLNAGELWCQLSIWTFTLSTFFSLFVGFTFNRTTQLIPTATTMILNIYHALGTTDLILTIILLTWVIAHKVHNWLSGRAGFECKFVSKLYIFSSLIYCQSKKRPTTKTKQSDHQQVEWSFLKSKDEA